MESIPIQPPNTDVGSMGIDPALTKIESMPIPPPDTDVGSMW